MSDRLGHKQTAAMLALMAKAREVSNPELKDIVGFTLTGRERTELNDLKLVASHKDGQRYVHELTDQGWAWCAVELAKRSAPPPPPRSTLVAALYLLVGEFADYFKRTRLNFADVLGAVDIESQIRAAYDQLARNPGDWIGLADLRPMLGGASREEVDTALEELSGGGQIHLAPEANRKALTKADHEAAIRIGADDAHLIRIEVS